MAVQGPDLAWSCRLQMELPWDLIELTQQLGQEDTMEAEVVNTKGQQLKIDLRKCLLNGVNKLLLNVYDDSGAGHGVLDVSKESARVALETLVGPVYLTPAGPPPPAPTPHLSPQDVLVENAVHGIVLAEPGVLVGVAGGSGVDAGVGHQVTGVKDEMTLQETVTVESPYEAPSTARLAAAPLGDSVAAPVAGGTAGGGLGQAHAMFDGDADDDSMVEDFLSLVDHSAQHIVTSEGPQIVTQTEILQSLLQHGEAAGVTVSRGTPVSAAFIAHHAQGTGHAAYVFPVHGQSVAVASAAKAHVVTSQDVDMEPEEYGGFGDDDGLAHQVDNEISVSIATPPRDLEAQPGSKSRLKAHQPKVETIVLMDMSKTVSDASLYQCYLCKKGFVRLKLLQSHVEKTHGAAYDGRKVVMSRPTSVAQCHICDVVVVNKYKLRRHYKTLHQVNLVDQRATTSCPLCRKMLRGTLNVRKHLKNMHLADPGYEEAYLAVREAIPGRKRQTRHVPCPSCLKDIPVYYLRKHVRAAHADDRDFPDLMRHALKSINRENQRKQGERNKLTAPCPLCGKVVTKRKIHSHQKTQVCKGRRERFRQRQGQGLGEDGDGDVVPGRSEFEAPEGGRRGKAQYKGKVHVKCPECERVLNRQCLRMHMYAVHRKVMSTPLKEHKCDGCGKIFFKKFNLRTHYERHHSDTRETFCCDMCGKEFLSREGLKVHVKIIHHRLFPFHCDVCSRGFWKRERLTRHKQGQCQPVKAKSKESLCELCGISITPHARLRFHMETVHQQKFPFRCGHCSRGFVLSGHVTFHMDRHRGGCQRLSDDDPAFCLVAKETLTMVESPGADGDVAWKSVRIKVEKRDPESEEEGEGEGSTGGETGAPAVKTEDAPEEAEGGGRARGKRKATGTAKGGEKVKRGRRGTQAVMAGTTDSPSTAGCPVVTAKDADTSDVSTPPGTDDVTKRTGTEPAAEAVRSAATRRKRTPVAGSLSHKLQQIQCKIKEETGAGVEASGDRDSRRTDKSPSGGSTDKSPSCGSTAKSPPVGGSNKSPSGGSTAKSPSGDSTAKSSSGDSTAKSPPVDRTAKSPSGGGINKSPLGGASNKTSPGGASDQVTGVPQRARRGRPPKIKVKVARPVSREVPLPEPQPSGQCRDPDPPPVETSAGTTVRARHRGLALSPNRTRQSRGAASKTHSTTCIQVSPVQTVSSDSSRSGLRRTRTPKQLLDL